MSQPSRVEQIDEYNFRVSVAGEPYFAGTSGRVLLEVMGLEGMPGEGEVFDAGLYEVIVERADETGVRALMFRFRRALSSPEYHFFLTSRQRMAYGLDFHGGGDRPALGAARRHREAVRVVWPACLHAGRRPDWPISLTGRRGGL